MKIQFVGLGNVGTSLIALIKEKERALKSLGIQLTVVSISDSEGTARNDTGLDLEKVLRYKEGRWKGFNRYTKGCSALAAIRNVESDVVVELTPSTPSGEPGLSHIRRALMHRKNVVTANKAPLVLSYKPLMELAKSNHVRLLYEAAVAAHLPVFCMIDSCFKADSLLHLEGILNATTNFIIGEMEKGKDFQGALDHAIKEGWTETDYSDDVDGTDAARKLVILANRFFKKEAKLENVKVEGIRNIANLLETAKESGRRVKLICAISEKRNGLEMSVLPKLVSQNDPLALVTGGDMAVKLTFQTSQQIFVVAQFKGVKQTAYAVLNDIVKLGSTSNTC